MSSNHRTVLVLTSATVPLLVLSMFARQASTDSPSLPSVAQQSAVRFTDVTTASGVIHTHRLQPPDNPLTTGVAWGDYDNDGYADLYVTSQGAANKLFRNRRDGTFEDVAVQAGVDDAGGIAGGAVWGDYDDDGWLDVYVLNAGANKLFRNNGVGAGGVTFSDVTEAAGVGDTGRGMSGSWGDYDRDGYVDLYVANYAKCATCAGETFRDRLYHNRGDGSFEDVTLQLGQTQTLAAGTIAGWFDYQFDGDLDLYLVNDDQEWGHQYPRSNVLWINQGSDGRGGWNWQVAPENVGANLSMQGMGLSISDYNGNAIFDLVLSDDERPHLLEGLGDSFTDSLVLSAGAIFFRTRGSLFFDHDNDGWQDVYLAAGDGAAFQPDMLMRNVGGTFQNVTGQVFLAGLSHNVGDNRAVAWADYDRDGDLDMYVETYGGQGRLLRNDYVGSAENRPHWLQIKLEGVVSDRNGIGATVVVVTSDGTQAQVLTAGSALGSCNEAVLHFGLGAATSVQAVAVGWPSGLRAPVRDVPVDRRITIREPSGTETPPPTHTPVTHTPTLHPTLTTSLTPTNTPTIAPSQTTALHTPTATGSGTPPTAGTPDATDTAGPSPSMSPSTPSTRHTPLSPTPDGEPCCKAFLPHVMSRHQPGLAKYGARLVVAAL